MLERDGQNIGLTAWGCDIVRDCAPIAAALEKAHGGGHYAAALAASAAALNDASLLPSARVLAAMAQNHDNAVVSFVRAQSEKPRDVLRTLPWADTQQAHFEALSGASVVAQKKIEADDTMPFEVYRQQYVSPQRLNVPAGRCVNNPNWL